ncbi:Progesterone-induced-blocking factor 1 [Acropora cervicornis]|uniref:Progesterone-induced-blocking factor 1 n=1 Tax=Acropora cervicornis TaxID=6130 RepID=A0AAD9PXW4_ACRCE|nr:Progesterone-induced-blocking factor 1 [Acropora cervicornis]
MSGRENGSLRSTHTNESNQNSTLRTENDTTSTENTTVESSTLLTNSALSSSQVDSEGDSRITKHEIERKQLLHDLELLRIELRQKNLVIDNMKVEHLGKVDELEELLDDNRHDKQILQARLESQLRLQQEEAKSALERMRQELAILLEKQKTLEVKNKKLEEKAFDYQIKIYEARHALSLECESLRHQVEALTHDLHAREEKRLQSQVNQGDYKITNFDQVRSERDTLDRDIMEMRKNNTVLNAALKTKTESLLDLQKELHTSKQTVALLKQDKDYMSRQSQEIRGRCTLAEERLEQTVKQLEETKQAREELYEKYISVREQYKSEYELRLKTEIDNIKDKTSVELDKIRVDTKEMFERENRNLREARDNAVEEKERACVNEKEMSLKYNQLQSGFRQLQLTSDSRQSDLQKEINVKQFELERTQMILGETANNLKQAKLEAEKFQSKSEVLNKEYYALQNSSEKRLVELESKCKEQSDKLDVYEKLEKELDDVIMQAAENAERVLFSYGYGANVPSTAKRRMQQSVQLARRVLHLERANTSLRNEMEREKKKKDLLGKELSKATSLLNEAQQPYNYLIESIRSRDMQNQSLNEQIALMEEDIRKMKAEKEDLISTRNQLSSDLERLLNQREEMAVMKQAILGLHSSKNSHSPLTRKIAGNHGQKSRHRTSAHSK